MTPSKASAREQNPKEATSPELIGQKKAHVSAVPGVSEEDAQIIIDLMNRKDQEEPERDLMLSIRDGGPVLLVRYSKQWFFVRASKPGQHTQKTERNTP